MWIIIWMLTANENANEKRKKVKFTRPGIDGMIEKIKKPG